jgi:hypothetical protein
LNMPSYSGTQYAFNYSPNLSLNRFFNLPANQPLSITPSIGFHRSNLKMDTLPGVTELGQGRVESDAWMFGGALNYMVNQYYVSGTALFERGRSKMNLGLNGATAKSDSDGYAVGGQIGRGFNLWTAPSTRSTMVTKAPIAFSGLLGVLLDVNVNATYVRNRADGFVDSTGFSFGDQEGHATIIGARARLSGFYLVQSSIVVPYALVGVDHTVDYSQRLQYPSQASVPFSDIIDFDTARTTGRVEVGVSSLLDRRFIVSAKAFHTFNSETQNTGVRGPISIPFSVQ